MNVKYFKAAGITVEVRSDFPIGENTFHPKFKKFEVDGPGEDTVVIHHHFRVPDTIEALHKKGEEIYNKDQWRISRTEDSWIYQFKSMTPLDPGHGAAGFFNGGYSSLSVYTDDFDEESYRRANLPALTLFNNDQVLFAPLLCERKGLIIHSNGFDVNGNGILLAGVSGAGKSTLSRMLKERGHGILCDDRMFVTMRESGCRIHGSWCHGSVPDTAAGSAPLKAILFLEHARENGLEEIQDKRNVTHRLLRAMVQPFLAPAGWHKTFDTLEEMVGRVRCYRVKFDLSGDICRLISDLQQ